MRISPVAGTPTIPQTAQTGNSPEKLARLKAIASGESPINVMQSEEGRRKPEPEVKRITMRTNHTVNRDGNTQPYLEDGTAFGAQESETHSDIPDNNVQANETAEATQPLSPQLAAIARQRRANQVKELELKEREAALSGPSRTELEARIKASPLSVLQEMGVTYDQLTQEILASQGGITPEIQALKEEIATLKGDVDKKLTDRDASAERAVLTEMAGNIERLCATGDDFEMIRSAKQQEEVLGRIYDHWQKTGKVRDELDVMKEVENELVEEALTFARLGKVQGKLTPAVPLQPQQDSGRGMRTLTNKDSAAPTMNRRQRAILAGQGNLKR